MKNTCFIILVVAVALSVGPILVGHAQPVLDPLWAQVQLSPGDYWAGSVGIAVDSAGYVYHAGSIITPMNRYEYALVKYSPEGTRLWGVQFNTSPPQQSDVLTDFVVDAAGNAFLTGYNYGDGININYITVKYNSQGQQMWMAEYDGPVHWHDFANAITRDLDGNVYVTGSSGGAAMYGHGDVTTVKYNPQGETLWVARYNGPTDEEDVGSDVVVDQEGNVYVTGVLAFDGYGDGDCVTLMYNSQGVQQWAAIYDSPDHGEDCGLRLAVDDQASVVVSGTSSEGRSPTFLMDLIVIRYDAVGAEQWVVRYDHPAVNSCEYPFELALDADGNIIIAGGIGAPYSSDGYLLMKYQPDGTLEWSDCGHNPKSASGLALDAGNSIYVTGLFDSPNSRINECFTWKYSPQGEIQWTARYDVGFDGEGGAHICLDNQNQVLVAGLIARPGCSFSDFLTLKYVQPIFESEAPTGVEAPAVLLSCSPNPFNPSTAISFQLSAFSHVSLKVYDIAGRLVATLVDGWREAGRHEVTFDGSGLAAGIYLYRLELSGSGATPTWECGKMVLMK